MKRILTLDFETRSASPLKSYRRYATHPTTGVLCIGLQWHDLTEGRTYSPPRGPVFLPGDPCPEEVLIAIREGYPIYAHNVAFDRTMWAYYCVPVLGWPEVPFEQWRCTMSVCAYYAVPQGLGKAAKALGLEEQKQSADEPGRLALSQCCKPRQPVMEEVARFSKEGLAPHQYPVLWWEDNRRLYYVYEYCKQDVKTQTELLLHLGELPPERLADWQLDQKINERGVPLDVPNLICTTAIVEQTLSEASSEINWITNREVEKVTSRDQILDYLHMQNVHLDSLDKDAVERALAEPSIQGVPRRVLELRQLAGKSSLAKVDAMLEHVDADGRVRDGLRWHGAATGRWTGSGVQWQNFPRDCMSSKDAEELFSLMEQVGSDMSFYNDLAELKGLNGVPTLLTQALRAFIRPEPGKGLLISDFNAIECRKLAWLSDCQLLQETFRKKECPYCQFGSRVTGKTVVKGMPERQLGKVGVLALGYQMGGPKLKTTAAGPAYRVTLTDEQAVNMVKMFRETYPEIPRLWKQYENAFIRAIESEAVIPAGKVSFGRRGKWAWIQLPSGRCLWYYKPEVQMAKTPWGAMQKKASHMTVDARTKQWVRRDVYGGLLVENCLAGDTMVITDQGDVRLDQVTSSHKVWDGIEWVSHCGLIRKGYHHTINFGGVYVTPDHLVWSNGWHESQNLNPETASSSCERSHWIPPRLSYSSPSGGQHREENDLGSKVRLRQHLPHGFFRDHPQKKDRGKEIVRVQIQRVNREGQHDSRRVTDGPLCSVASNDRPMPVGDSPGVPELRGERDHRMLSVGEFIRGFPGGHATHLPERNGAGSKGQHGGVLPRELSLDDSEKEYPQQKKQRAHQHQVGQDNCCRGIREIRGGGYYDLLSDIPSVAGKASAGHSGFIQPVYDLLDAGPRHRFMIRRPDGRPLLVHNCDQGSSADILAAAMHRMESNGFSVIASIHDEIVVECEDAEDRFDEFHRLMEVVPEWASGCYISAESHVAGRYGK